MIILVNEETKKVTGYQTFPTTTDAPHFIADEIVANYVVGNPDILAHIKVVGDSVYTLEDDWQARAEARLGVYVDESLKVTARGWRDTWLAATDKYMIADWPITSGEKTDITGFRVELREWPNLETFPADSPTVPAVLLSENLPTNYMDTLI